MVKESAVTPVSHTLRLLLLMVEAVQFLRVSFAPPPLKLVVQLASLVAPSSSTQAAAALAVCWLPVQLKLLLLPVSFNSWRVSASVVIGFLLLLTRSVTPVES